MFLNGVVGQMHEEIFIVNVENARTCTDVALLVPVSLETTVDRCQEDEASDIKFAFFVQERSIDVLLQDVCPPVAFFRDYFSF